MKLIDVEITGISPILQHRFPMETAEKKPRQKNKDQQADNVEQSLYRLPDGTIYQPAIHILSSMKKAGSKFQIPGQGKSTYKNLVGSGAVIISPDAIPHKNQSYDIDARPVVNPSTKGRIVRMRPMLTHWMLHFQIEYDETEISCKDINEILSYAGKRIGIGDFRPEKGGSFGRFMISNFKEI